MENATPSASATPAVQQIPIDQIVPSPFQARKVFDATHLQELAQSMKEHRQLTPVQVRPVGDHFELIAGERRWRAAKLLGWTTLRAEVEQVDDQEAAVQGLIENLQREDLNPIERARGYQQLADMGLTQNQIAEQVGVSDRDTIYRYLALLSMPEEIQAMLPRGSITERHARIIRQIKDRDQQIAIARQVEKEGWSVKEIERRVNQLLGTAKAIPHSTPKKEDGSSDPLADLWTRAMNDPAVAPVGTWRVGYGKHNIVENGPSELSWQFIVVNDGLKPTWQLKEWFLKMAEAMGDTEKEQAVLVKNSQYSLDLIQNGLPPEIEKQMKEHQKSMTPEQAAQYQTTIDHLKALKDMASGEEGYDEETRAAIARQLAKGRFKPR